MNNKSSYNFIVYFYCVVHNNKNEIYKYIMTTTKLNNRKLTKGQLIDPVPIRVPVTRSGSNFIGSYIIFSQNLP